MNQEPRKCRETRKNGQPCRANALPGKSTCAFHTPELAGRCQQGRRAGAKTRNGTLRVLPFPAPSDETATAGPTVPKLTNAKDVAGYLAFVIGSVVTGKLDHRIANSAGILLGTLLRAIEASDTEQRLLDLEAKLAATKKVG
jgi:hypothetical protein